MKRHQRKPVLDLNSDLSRKKYSKFILKIINNINYILKNENTNDKFNLQINIIKIMNKY